MTRLIFPPPPELGHAVQGLTVSALARPMARTLWPDAHIEVVFWPGGPGDTAHGSTLGLQWEPVRRVIPAGLTLRVRLFSWVPPALYRPFQHRAAALRNEAFTRAIASSLSAGDVTGAVEATWAWVREALAELCMPAPLRTALHHITADPERFTLTGLPDLCGASERTLERQSRAALGCTLKGFHRLARFERALLSLWEGCDPSTAELAARLGYADQAHLSREVRRFCGLPPGALAAASRRVPEMFKTAGGPP